MARWDVVPVIYNLPTRSGRPLLLVRRDELELLQLKGPDLPVERMGRIIDPYIFRDRDRQEKWWCFFKQNGVSMSWSSDLSNWTYVGSMNGGENAALWSVQVSTAR